MTTNERAPHDHTDLDDSFEPELNELGLPYLDDEDEGFISPREIAGKTVEGAELNMNAVPGPWGDEPAWLIRFTDGTFTFIVMPAPDDE